MFAMVLDLWLKFETFSKTTLNKRSGLYLVSFMSSKFCVKEKKKEASIEWNNAEQSHF